MRTTPPTPEVLPSPPPGRTVGSRLPCDLAVWPANQPVENLSSLTSQCCPLLPAPSPTPMTPAPAAWGWALGPVLEGVLLWRRPVDGFLVTCERAPSPRPCIEVNACHPVLCVVSSNQSRIANTVWPNLRFVIWKPFSNEIRIRKNRGWLNIENLVIFSR